MSPQSSGRRSHGETTYLRLRKELVDGTIPPGTRLLESEIGERLGVSRTPVREALRRLESDGFVQRLGPNKIVATPMGPDDIGDIGLLRVEIDGLAARLAATRATPDDWARIRERIDALLDIKEGDDEALSLAHSKIHRAVYAAGFGPRMAFFVENHILPYVELTTNAGSGKVTPASVHRSHLTLLRALSSGDLERAVAAARRHAGAGARAAKAVRASRRASNGR